MKWLLSVCFALLASISYAQIENEYQPMVAFKCNYPSMYLTEKGWMKDDDSDCVDDAEDVLDYCKKMFPSLDVRNVVESGQMYTINGWCNVGETSCDQSFTIRPYRCLVGPFQSDALLVPASCTFDHEHRSRECKTFAEWNATAVQRCSEHDRVAQSFAVLQPCEDSISRFDGVEFVCCPKTDAEAAPLNKVSEQALPTEISSSEESEEKSQPVATDSNNAHYRYVHSAQVPTDLKVEHAQFVEAKAELQRQHRAAVNLLEDDWKRVTQRVQRMKETDPQGAEKLEREATARFQKTSKALEDDGQSDKRQLDIIHQQRVDTILTSLRMEALDSYHQALGEQPQDTEKILNSLKRYIRREQKERQHVENRYHHLLQSDPEQLAVEKHQMADKLRLISQRIKEAVEELDEVKEDQQKLRQQIDDFMQTFSQLDRSATFILNDDGAVEPEASINVNSPSIVEDASSSTDSETDQKPANPVSIDQPKPAEQPTIDDEQAPIPSNEDEVQKAEIVENDDHSSDTSSEEESNVNQQAVSEEQKPLPPVTGEIEALSDEEDDDDESDADENGENNDGESNEATQPKHNGDFFNNDEIELNEAQPFKPQHEGRHMSAGAVIGTIGGCMAIVALVIAAVIVLHRRINQAPRHGPAFASVPQSLSPEDHHIVSMQMTGYENPTYRFFEDGGSAKA